jgi:hypothetical protein
MRGEYIGRIDMVVRTCGFLLVAPWLPAGTCPCGDETSKLRGESHLHATRAHPIIGYVSACPRATY